MDKHTLLNKEVQDFILAHEKDDLPGLMLQKNKYTHLPLKDIVEQIAGRRKAKTKLPRWYNTRGIIYPPLVSVEQSSSEIAAEFKSKLLKGKRCLDLTGGFGVDSYFLSGRFERVTYVEPNNALATIALNNFEALGHDNIKIVNTSAEEFLVGTQGHYDLIYVDPDRRPETKRVRDFSGSKPNIVKLLPQLVEIGYKVMVKASPMMDIDLAINQLKLVTKVIVLAIDNEVKELLFILSSKREPSINIRCVNIKKDKTELLEYNDNNDYQEELKLSNVLAYLYEPNAAIMKARAFNPLLHKFHIKKLHPNTHLFTSDKLIEDFPGRQFKVLGVSQYKKASVGNFLKSGKANISTRNFVDTPEQLKKKLGLQDGGDQYLFGFRDYKNKLVVVVCEKL